MSRESQQLRQVANEVEKLEGKLRRIQNCADIINCQVPDWRDESVVIANPKIKGHCLFKQLMDAIEYKY